MVRWLVFPVAALAAFATLWAAVPPQGPPDTPHFVGGTDAESSRAHIRLDAARDQATLHLVGVAGATMTVTDLLNIKNPVARDITMGGIGAPHPAITGYRFTVMDGAEPLGSYDATDVAGSTFRLPAGTFDVRIELTITPGTPAGDLGAFTLTLD